MSFLRLIHHPEEMNVDTLYELRRVIAANPFCQPARLLMLKNLYLLHDPSFEDELRRSAIYFTDRKVLFNFVEAAHYRLKQKSPQSFSKQPDRHTVYTENENGSRTISLIDNFLQQIPENEEEEEKTGEEKRTKARKPTAVDATVDYVAYLLATDFEELQENEGSENNPQSFKGGDLIEKFIQHDGGHFSLQEEIENQPEVKATDDKEAEVEEDFLTETLAGIYIKQGKYMRALEIMDKIDKTKVHKNPFFEEQRRYLKKLIQIQEKTNKTKKKNVYTFSYSYCACRTDDDWYRTYSRV